MCSYVQQNSYTRNNDGEMLDEKEENLTSAENEWNAVGHQLEIQITII